MSSEVFGSVQQGYVSTFTSRSVILLTNLSLQLNQSSFAMQLASQLVSAVFNNDIWPSSHRWMASTHAGLLWSGWSEVDFLVTWRGALRHCSLADGDDWHACCCSSCSDWRTHQLLHFQSSGTSWIVRSSDTLLWMSNEHVIGRIRNGQPANIV